jgi:hypothetical protein
MIVARQFTAWDLRGNKTRPVGYGVIRPADSALSRGVANTGPPDQTVPYGTVHFRTDSRQ